jgi:hypothetical protein
MEKENVAPRTKRAARAARKAAPKKTAPAVKKATAAPAVETIRLLKPKDKYRFQSESKRGRAFGLIKDGMPVENFFARCAKASINGRGVLQKLVAVGLCKRVA